MIYSILHTNHANPSPNTQAMGPVRQLFMKLTNYDYPVKETFMIFTTQSSNCPQNLSTKVVCKRFILKRIFLYWLETIRNSGWSIITHCIVCLCTADIPVVNFTIKVSFSYRLLSTIFTLYALSKFDMIKLTLDSALL